MREAQGNAKRDKLTWQVSFQEVNVNGDNVIQWAVHPATATANISWNSLEPNIYLDNETTLQGRKQSPRLSSVGCGVCGFICR